MNLSYYYNSPPPRPWRCSQCQEWNMETILGISEIRTRQLTTSSWVVHSRQLLIYSYLATTSVVISVTIVVIHLGIEFTEKINLFNEGINEYTFFHHMQPAW